MEIILGILLILGLCMLGAPESNPVKSVTIEDVRKKYPKRKSQEQLRRESEQKLELERFKELEHQQLVQAIQKEEELFALVRDRKTADRLLRGIRRKHPKQGRLWIAEKAIADIHRDRRAY